jgi:bifunctional oligoribonuclease and PAP phosphatase NrnA
MWTPKQSNLLAGLENEVSAAGQILEKSRKVLIIGHEHPDGDALGSALALWHALRLQGKQATVYVPDTPPVFFGFLPGFELITTDSPAVHEYDTAVVVDCTYLARTRLEKELKNHPVTLVIDHHADNRREGKVNLVVPEAAATAYILAVLMAQAEMPITKDTATCLLTGIFTDTGSFMHDATTPEILKLAAFLMSQGARLSHIAHETYQRKELPALKIWGAALSRAVVNKTTGVAVSVVTYDDLARCGAKLDDLGGVVNMLNTLPDTKFALLLTEYVPGKIKGSLRSEPHKGMDVSKIAKRLGGGGHRLAAGFSVEGRLVQREGQWRIVA